MFHPGEASSSAAGYSGESPESWYNWWGDGPISWAPGFFSWVNDGKGLWFAHKLAAITMIFSFWIAHRKWFGESLLLSWLGTINFWNGRTHFFCQTSSSFFIFWQSYIFFINFFYEVTHWNSRLPGFWGSRQGEGLGGTVPGGRCSILKGPNSDLNMI